MTYIDENELALEVTRKAVAWREAEVYEFETDSYAEREERHYATNSALCQIRRAVMDLMEYRRTGEVHRRNG